MDEELLEVLHRYRARAKGYPPERPRPDIDVAGLKEFHLAAFSELFEGTRSDDYLLANRYWTCIYLCPYTDCDCHKLRVAFFDDKAKPGSGDTVGSVLLDLGGAEGVEIAKMAAECGAPEHLIREPDLREPDTDERMHPATRLARTMSRVSDVARGREQPLGEREHVAVGEQNACSSLMARACSARRCAASFVSTISIDRLAKAASSVPDADRSWQNLPRQPKIQELT